MENQNNIKNDENNLPNHNNKQSQGFLDNILSKDLCYTYKSKR